MNKYDWKNFLLPYELAVSSFVMKLTALRKEFSARGKRSPIEIVSGRIKTVDSILEKANRLNIMACDIEEQIFDIAGVRIICKYVQDVYAVLDLLTSRKDLFTIQIKDYIKEPKQSGYRSVHLLAKYRVETIDGSKMINMEFQIRTHAMHLWASIEHSLKYKYYRNIPQNIKDRLMSAANVSSLLDEELEKIKVEIESTDDVACRNDGEYGDFEVVTDDFFH